MRKIRVIFWDKSVDKTLEVSPSGRVCIFHNNKATTGMAAEDGYRAGLQPTSLQTASDCFCNFYRRFSRRTRYDFFSVNTH
jgi:hypothetical protein